MVPYMQILKSYTDMSIGCLSPFAQVVYFRLFLINNRAGWTEQFSVSNQRLMLETGINSKHTLERARCELINHNFIDYVPGKKGSPSKYKIICPNVYPQKSQAVANEADNQEKGALNAPKTGTNIKYGANNAPNTGEKTGTKTGENPAPIIHNNYYNNNHPKKAAAAPAGEDFGKNNEITMPFAQVNELFEKNIHRITSEIEQNKLTDLVVQYGVEWVIAAIEEGAVQHARTAKYIAVILERWEREGFKSARNVNPANKPVQSKCRLRGVDGLRQILEGDDE